MSIEIEKKYRLADGDLERVKNALTESGGEFVGSEFEENIIFSGAALLEGAIVRIRTTGSRTRLTFKRRIESEFAVKKQIEHEIEVSDAEVTSAILNELGLRPRLIYEKYRDTWNFRSVEVVLDRLPFGEFMEIEGSITAIKEAEMILGIEDLVAEHETYPSLTARMGTNVEGVIEARFN